jgi:glycerophosphoryl diester phosphodiesterase
LIATVKLTFPLVAPYLYRCDQSRVSQEERHQQDRHLLKGGAEKSLCPLSRAYRHELAPSATRRCLMATHDVLPQRTKGFEMKRFVTTAGIGLTLVLGLVLALDLFARVSQAGPVARLPLGVVDLDAPAFVDPDGLAQSSPDLTPAFIMANRGGAGEKPENTLEAFAKAIGLGVSLEMDVCLTLDHYVVVDHDCVASGTDIANLTLAQVKSADSSIPHIDQVFQLFTANASSGSIVSIDTKVENNVMYDQLIKAIDTYRLFDRVYVEVTDSQIASAIKTRPKGDQLDLAMWVAADTALFDEAIANSHIERIHVLGSFLTTSRVEQAHINGKTVVPGFIDTLDDWNNVKNLAIDGINTDYPEHMKAVLGLADINFTSGSQTGQHYGVHEISLTGNGAVSNPFIPQVQVTFTPPSGSSGAVTVRAFYDGGNTWKARAYLKETGLWQWSVTHTDDSSISPQSGSFGVTHSTLSGKLRTHPQNDYQWVTDSGRTFLNLTDTAYVLFREPDPAESSREGVSEAAFRQYVEDDFNLGITALRAGGLGGYAGWGMTSSTLGGLYDRSNWCWQGSDYSRYYLERFQSTDERLKWLLNNYPEIYLQLIFLGKNSECGPGSVGDLWFDISQSDREATLDYMLARWAAWPQLYYLIMNDIYCNLDRSGDDCDNNRSMVREIGQYLTANDPWQHLTSSGCKRREPNPFTTDSDLTTWHSYIHIERYSEIDARVVDDYRQYPAHLYLGEDWYEQQPTRENPAEPPYYYRRMFWSVLLSGGSPNYGGRYPVIHPYSQTGTLDFPVSDEYTYRDQLTGLDDILYLKSFLRSRQIDFAQFIPNDGLAAYPPGQAPNSSGTPDPSRIQLAHSHDHGQYLLYLPNPQDGESAGGEEDSPAADSRRLARPNQSKTASVRLDLGNASGDFSVEWLNPQSGDIITGTYVSGGSQVDLIAPWTGGDAVLYLFPLPTPQTASRTIAAGDAPSVDFGSARLALDCATGPGGTVTVTVHGADYSDPPGIRVMSGYWEVTSDFGGPFSCDLTFTYTENALNGAAEDDIAGAARWDEGNARWSYLGGTVDADTNTVTVTDVTAFSPWLLITPLPAEGVYYVAPGGNCGTGNLPCYDNPQAAVDAAVDPSDVIKVAAGWYTDTHARPRHDLSSGGTVTQVVYISKTVTIQGGYTTTNWITPDAVNNPTTLDARGQGRAIYITGDISVTVEGLRITGGNADDLGGYGPPPLTLYHHVGGGVYAITATVTLRDNWIFDNGGAGYGGGVGLRSCTSVLDANTIYSNTATSGGAGGGGIWMQLGRALLTGNEIYSNTCQGNGGGLLSATGTLTLIDNVVRDNEAGGSGGGLYVYDSTATFESNLIRGNYSEHGGGVYLYWLPGTTELTDNTVISNTATEDGGGIYALSADGARFDRNRVLSNTAQTGGGLYLSWSNATLANTAVVGNHASALGSGLAIYGSSPHLLHTTIVGQGGADGGVHIADIWDRYSTVAMTNTVVAGYGVGITVTGGNTASVSAVLWHNTAVTVSQSATATLVLQNQYAGDPALASDGYHLTYGSAAIDSGVHTGALTDIDGEPRADGYPDIGADELGIDVFFTPAAQARSGQPGVTVTYTVQLINGTGVADSFGLAIQPGSAWNVALSTSQVGPIDSGDAVTLSVYVTIPMDAAWYSTDVVQVVATSVANPTVYSDTATLTTQANPPPEAVADLGGTRSGSDVQLTWTAVTADILGNPMTLDHYVVYRRADAPYFVPTPSDVIATPATPSFTDPGVLGDAAHNYYYVVTSVDAAGQESAPSNRVGAFDQALTPAGQAGERAYNLIALSLKVPGVSDADSLAAYVGGVYMVLRHDALTQSIEWRLPGLAGTNFPVEVGEVYFLYLDETAPSVVSLVGGVPAMGEVSFALARPDPGGACAYNFISVPLHRDDLVDADALAADIGGIYTVSRYNVVTQDMTWRMPGGPGENFPVRPGYPYILCLEEAGPATWP